MFESLSMEWNRRLRGLTMFDFHFGVESLEQSANLDRLVIFDSLGNSLFKDSLNTTFSKWTIKKQYFLQCFRC